MSQIGPSNKAEHRTHHLSDAERCAMCYVTNTAEILKIIIYTKIDDTIYKSENIHFKLFS